MREYKIMKNNKRQNKLQRYLDPFPLIRRAELFEWNYKRIAESANVDPKTVYSWRKNKAMMSIRSADNLCIALDTTLEAEYPYV